MDQANYWTAGQFNGKGMTADGYLNRHNYWSSCQFDLYYIICNEILKRMVWLY